MERANGTAVRVKVKIGCAVIRTAKITLTGQATITAARNGKNGDGP